MHHVHTRTVASHLTTKEPVSTLSPAVLFPFFQSPSTASTASSASSASSSSTPPSSPSSAVPLHSVGGTRATSKTHDSSCPCHSLDSLPVSAIGPSTFLTLPSMNSHQPLMLPLPQPPAPPQVSTPTGSDPSEAAAQSGDKPLMVFSHGSTSVDTFVPSLSRLQRTVYAWSQLSDYTPKHCWELPATSSSTSQSSEPEGQPGASQNMALSICRTVGRQCQPDEMERCPGHPWVSFSYHMQVTQWQEDVDQDPFASADAAEHSDQSSQPCCSPPHAAEHRPNMGTKGVEIRLAAPSGALRDRRRQSRPPVVPRTMNSDSGAAIRRVDEYGYRMVDSAEECDASEDEADMDEMNL